MTAVTSPPGPRGTAPHPRRWAGLIVLSAGLLVVVMDITILNVALPAISADLRPSGVEQLWVVDAYSLAVAGLLVTAGALGDRVGRKRTLLAGFVIFGVASLLVLVATDPVQLIAVRVLLGVGGAVIMPSTLSMVRNLFTDRRERATALGAWAAMAAVGGAVGPVLGGLLLEHFTWHAAFLVNVPVMALAIGFGLVLLPESRNPRPGRWDALGTVLSIVGMVALVYAIKQFGEHGIAEPGALIALALAALALTWFARRSLRRPDPLLELRLFTRRPLTAGVVAALTTELAMAAMLLLMAQWMQLVEGYSPLQTGLALLPAAAGAAVFSPMAPKIADRIGERATLSGGLAVAGLGFLALYVIPGPLNYAVVGISLLLIGAGMGSLAIGSVLIMGSAPPELSGNAAAIEETSYDLGGALGVAVLGSVAAAVFRAGLPAGAPAAARESLAGALGTPVADRAREAFTVSLEAVGLAGGAVMLVAAAICWWLVSGRVA